MKLQFKVQQYQTEAVDAVVDCFAGQPTARRASRYRIDPGKASRGTDDLFERGRGSGLRNAEIALTPPSCWTNIHEVQRRAEPAAVDEAGRTARPRPALNLDIEMETGTGKTYCYIKTIFELNKRYGWSKFIVVVPSHRHPRGRGEVARDHRRALPADLRQEAALLHLQLQAAARAGELLAPTPAST